MVGDPGTAARTITGGGDEYGRARRRTATAPRRRWRACSGTRPCPRRSRGTGEALETALATHLIGTWPEGDTYLGADQPRAIGRVLIGALHEHLVNCRIAVLFRQVLAGRGDRAVGAKASLAGAKLRHLAQVDGVIEVNWEAWRRLGPRERVALMDHELCHFGRNDETGRYVLIDHDVEEFGAIVTRWGAWTPQLVHFARVVQQLDLFRVVGA